MNSSSIVVLIVFVVFIAAAVGAFFLIRAKRRKEVARIDALSPVEREHHDALVEQEAAMKGAEKSHQSEVKARESRMKAAEKALSKAQQIGTTKLAGYRGKDGFINLTGTTIQTAQGTWNLGPSVNAVVDTAGNLATSSRSTFTRVAAGGLLFGPVGAIVGGVAKKGKIHDTRELYLMVEGPDFAGVVTCNPDDGAKVRQFAVAVKQAALNAGNIAGQREHAIAQTFAALDAEKNNLGALTQAAAALEAARNNTGRIDSANRALEAERVALSAPAEGE
jgi:hypothetical protein